MNKIVIIGCGNVGMAYAYSVLNQCLDVKELILIDVDKEKLSGKVADLNHSTYNLNTSTKVILGNYSDCQDADIVCITAGPKQSDIKTSRMDDLHKANSILKNILSEINKTNFSGIYLIATNPLDVMTYVTWKYANCDPKKVIGSGTLLDTARLRYVLSEKYHKPITEMTGLVLGEHGDSQFIPWSTVNVEKLPESEMTNIENAAYGSTMCAERNAIFQAYCQGYRQDDIEALAIVGDCTPLISPCGACRQVLAELMNPLTPIILGNKDYYEVTNMQTLLPRAFTGESL